jgi:DNA repair exonuclease SbcCD ATPase subunit
MIVFKKLRYKNFLSTGQQFIEIGLDSSATTLVMGDNGAGKSTMLDALCFGLFQRAFICSIYATTSKTQAPSCGRNIGH